MFKIIDRTLTAIKLEADHPTGEMLINMCKLLAGLGVDYIEISIPILKRMGELPTGPKYILKIEDIDDLGIYHYFDLYVWKSKNDTPIDHVIHEIQVNDIREVPLLNRYKNLKNVRITGLDALMCSDYKPIMKKMQESFEVPLNFSPQNNYYCATAMALEWLLNGGKSIAVSFNGVGGYAVLEEIIVAMKVIMHKKLGIDLSILPEVSLLYEKMTQSKITSNKAILGKNIFNVEAGIHVDGIEKNSFTYEPYDPKIVGKTRHVIVGKHSGTHAIKIKLKEKGESVPEGMLSTILEKVQEESINKRRSLTDREFIYIVKGVIADEEQALYR